MGINKSPDLPDLSVDIAGVHLKNPIITASGTCGFGRDYLEYYSPSDIGAITTKGLSLAPREGNKTPRVAETPGGMLNAIGLQNPGVEYFIEHELPQLRQYDAKIIANIFGNSIDEYCEVTKILSDTDIDMIEMNISCPNVKEGGVHFGIEPRMVENITSSVKKVSKKPVIVKLSPNVTDITAIAKAAECGGADALSLINTLLGMRIDIHSRRPVIKNNVGGLSGAAIKPVAVRMVWQVRNTVKLPIIGMGGIVNGDDAIEFILAGANAVAVGTAAFNDPYTVIKVREEIAEYMTNNGVSSIKELSGTVKAW